MATITPYSSPPQADPDLVGPSNSLFDDPEADVVLLSRDFQIFRVLKLYIIRSSTVLSDLIRAASDTSGTANVASSNEERLPEVRLYVSSTILSSLLTFIFPIPPVLPSTLEETMELLSVAQQYEMSSVLTHIRGFLALRDLPFIRPENSFLAYSVAQRYGLRKEAAQAARLTLKFKLTIESLEERHMAVPGPYLHELWKFHKTVRTELLSGLSAPTFNATLTALKCTREENWVLIYVRSIINNPSLFDPIEFQMTLARHTSGTSSFSGSACSSCDKIPVETIRTFWVALGAVVHRCMEKVSSVDVDFTPNLFRPPTGRVRAVNPRDRNELSKRRGSTRHPYASARILGQTRGGHHSSDIRPRQFHRPQVGTGLLIADFQGYVFPPKHSKSWND